MKYWEMFKEENEAVEERHELALQRIGQFAGEETVEEPYRDYFRRTAEFILMAEDIFGMQNSGELEELDLDEAKALNRRLYEDVLPGRYDESYANPTYAVKRLGTDFGRYLSFLYTEIRGMIVYAFESRLADMTILEELFIEAYNLFEGETPELKELKEILYYFVSDYCDVMLTYRVRETLDPSLDFAKSIIMDSDLSDLRYLYRFGEYISESELKVASFLNSLPEETVRKMADTYTEGLRKGFVASGREYKGKKTVQIRYHIGFERIIRMAVVNFRNMGLEPVISRAAVGTVNRAATRTNGYYATPANRQYDYDHRYDSAIYLDKAFKERKLSVLKVAYEEYKTLARGYAGPAVVETFGEEGFAPENKKEAFALNEKQEKLLLAYANESMQITDAYVPGMETSFTIIAFPLPEIGRDFEAIFEETIRINTLDYELYRDIQQLIIDALDQAEYVRVYGMGENRTDLRINLRQLSDPDKETKFENCVADVNIPVGEVFTSPVLSGTDGTLFVGCVYIGDYQFKNLYMEFKDGKVTDYGCANFADEKEGKALVKQAIMKNHDSLPMGEFAIGTNTTAYAVAQKYQILDKFPILIAEKMGPHFAVGDTCYSWMEDCPMHNPDGKEIVAKENEISVRRSEDPAQAYFNCHTDITIPYSELDRIEAVHADGTVTPVIAGGRFVLPGTEKLNEPLE
ncbi:aminopeptidase [[Clostridium] symbiosum]|uniref:aminopeptidase n=1 Tax=Clostridium symbiosum TaxID=1512 RepID=UPI001D060A04|nr:aminopeptidase [[Clostridium] symbiosum]MCB6607461.1 aminopeptidase [[Clostridium] symbiosum]MCB6930793.1 aminopeptidase [[Clostridium] symbiosum]